MAFVKEAFKEHFKINSDNPMFKPASNSRIHVFRSGYVWYKSFFSQLVVPDLVCPLCVGRVFLTNYFSNKSLKKIKIDPVKNTSCSKKLNYIVGSLVILSLQ